MNLKPDGREAVFASGSLSLVLSSKCFQNLRTNLQSNYRKNPCISLPFFFRYMNE